VYYAGEAVGVHRASEAEVDCQKPYGRGDLHEDASGAVYYFYGTCYTSGEEEGGCEEPVQVISEPLCQARPAIYGWGGKPDRRGHRRGVPSAWWRYDQRLELYTRTTTIAIYAWKRSLIRKTVRQLHVAPRYNLPRRGHPREHFRREPHARRHYGRLPAPTRHQMRTKKDCG